MYKSSWKLLVIQMFVSYTLEFSSFCVTRGIYMTANGGWLAIELFRQSYELELELTTTNIPESTIFGHGSWIRKSIILMFFS